MASYIFGWQDPRESMYTSEKMISYAAVRTGGWKPWRWRVVKVSTLAINPTPETVADNLTQKEAEGMVKLLEGIRDEQP